MTTKRARLPGPGSHHAVWPGPISAYRELVWTSPPVHSPLELTRPGPQRPQVGAPDPIGSGGASKMGSLTTAGALRGGMGCLWGCVAPFSSLPMGGGLC